MEIIKVIPSGFCSGVINAINLLKKTRQDYPNKPIYIIGHLVHNHYISDYFNTLGIQTITNPDKEAAIDSIDSGVVVFSAHGISDKIKNKALDKGLIVVDATCPFVLKTKNIIIEHLSLGYEILYVGKNKHPEAMAILSISDHIHLIEKSDDLNNLASYDKVFITNQTTMSIYEINDLFKDIKTKYPHAIFSDEICNATRMRQKAILDINEADLLYVVGDPSSNNSNKLKEIALSQGIKKVLLIKSAQDINLEHLKDVSKVYVTSGASTPNYLRDQVIDVLNNYNLNHDLIKPEIELMRMI